MWPETLVQTDADRAQEAAYYAEMRRQDEAVDAWLLERLGTLDGDAVDAWLAERLAALDEDGELEEGDA